MGFVSWQHYCTASSSGRQPNFTALNRGRHLCSAGRLSRWALAHILVLIMYFTGYFFALNHVFVTYNQRSGPRELLSTSRTAPWPAFGLKAAWPWWNCHLMIAFHCNCPSCSHANWLLVSVCCYFVQCYFLWNLPGVALLGILVMAALRSSCGHYIFVLWFLLLSSS